MPADIVGKPQEWFVFDDENRLRFKSKENSFEGELLRDQKFLITSQEATATNPYGLGDLSLCFWAATFKKGGFKYWLEFTEKYGTPYLVGKHQRQTSEPDKELLADALEEMVGSAIAVIPDDAKVEILEAAGKGASSDAHERFLNFCKGEINIALLGQNQTTEQEANRASAQAGLEVVEDIRNDDKAIIEETFNQLLEWICQLNFSVETLPKFELYEQESIDTAQVERDERLFGIGVRFSQAYLERTYGFEKGDISVQAVTSSENFANAANFAERVIGKRSGQPRIVRVPKGVDPSFEQPKRLVPVHQVDKILMQKLETAPPQFASSAVSNVLNYPPALALLNRSMTEMVDTVAAEKLARGNMKYVGVVPREVIKQLEVKELAPQTAVIAVRDSDILHALRDVKQGKGINLPVEFWQQLPEKLRNPSAILLDDTQKQPTLLFIYQTDQGKVAVKMDYEVQVKNQTTNKKERIKLNMVRTASVIKDTEKSWESLKAFEVLWGSLK